MSEQAAQTIDEIQSRGEYSAEMIRPTQGQAVRFSFNPASRWVCRATGHRLYQPNALSLDAQGNVPTSMPPEPQPTVLAYSNVGSQLVSSCHHVVSSQAKARLCALTPRKLFRIRCDNTTHVATSASPIAALPSVGHLAHFAESVTNPTNIEAFIADLEESCRKRLSEPWKLLDTQASLIDIYISATRRQDWPSAIPIIAAWLYVTLCPRTKPATVESILKRREQLDSKTICRHIYNLRQLGRGCKRLVPKLGEECLLALGENDILSW